MAFSAISQSQVVTHFRMNWSYRTGRIRKIRALSFVLSTHVQVTYKYNIPPSTQ